jgi:hypothetical protein
MVYFNLNAEDKVSLNSIKKNKLSKINDFSSLKSLKKNDVISDSVTLSSCKNTNINTEYKKVLKELELAKAQQKNAEENLQNTLKTIEETRQKYYEARVAKWNGLSQNVYDFYNKKDDKNPCYFQTLSDNRKSWQDLFKKYLNAWKSVMASGGYDLSKC